MTHKFLFSLTDILYSMITIVTTKKFIQVYKNFQRFKNKISLRHIVKTCVIS